MRASDGERDRGKSHMSEAWTGEALNKTRRHQCMDLNSNIVNTVNTTTASDTDDVNKIATAWNNPLQFKIQEYVLSQTRVHDVSDKESSNNVKDRMGEIDKHVSDGINKLLIENECDLTSQEELSADEAKKLADSLNLKLRDECRG